MICPACNGNGGGFALVQRTDGSGGPEWRDCYACGGAKETSEERWAEFQGWREIGRRMRDDREERGVSLGAEARTRGLSPAALSAMEVGYAKPEPRQEVGG
jgi:hypothetical protein